MVAGMNYIPAEATSIQYFAQKLLHVCCLQSNWAAVIVPAITCECLVLCCVVYNKCIPDDAHQLSQTIHMLFNRVFYPIAVSKGQIPVVTQQHYAN